MKKRFIETYKRLFIRNFSLTNIQIWYRAESKNKKQWTKNKQKHQPYIVFERENDLVTVYYSQNGISWMENELNKKIRTEKDFLQKLRQKVEEKNKPIKKIYKNVKTLNYKELVKFLCDFEDCYSWMEALWFICTIVDLKDIDISSLAKIRRETDNFASNTELVIRKSIENCFPKYKNYSDVISEKEIKTKKIASIDELKERKRAYIFTDNKLFVQIERKAIEKKYNIKIEKDNIKKRDVLKGKSIYKGKVQGRVKIIMSFQDVKKFKKNDILISSMTTPDILPATKKAKAIVTDEGGFLCHAAIVSREFKIPCIVGTKIATKVLKDGDLVEVDANKGIVKILEKKR